VADVPSGLSLTPPQEEEKKNRQHVVYGIGLMFDLPLDFLLKVKRL
jgi:hypothetical protein